MNYDNNNRSITVSPRTFHVLYIGPNNNSNDYSIFKLSTQQILVIMKYQPLHAPEHLIKNINEVDLCNNKVQTDHLGSVLQ